MDLLIKRSGAELESKIVYKFLYSCIKCITRFYLRLPVILVQMQSAWDRFETFVVLGESSNLFDGCNYFN